MHLCGGPPKLGGDGDEEPPGGGRGVGWFHTADNAETPPKRPCRIEKLTSGLVLFTLFVTLCEIFYLSLSTLPHSYRIAQFQVYNEEQLYVTDLVRVDCGFGGSRDLHADACFVSDHRRSPSSPTRVTPRLFLPLTSLPRGTHVVDILSFAHSHSSQRTRRPLRYTYRLPTLILYRPLPRDGCCRHPFATHRCPPVHLARQAQSTRYSLPSRPPRLPRTAHLTCTPYTLTAL